MQVDVTLERKLPHNLEAERAVLGAILLDNEAFHPAIETLEPPDFFLDSHRRIFWRMSALSEENRAIDLITLHEDLERAGELEAAGGSAYLAMLVDGVPRVSNVEYYAQIVKEKAVLRDLIHASDDIINQALGRDADPAVLLPRAAEAFGILSAQPRNGVWAQRKTFFRTGTTIGSETPSEISWIARPWVAAGSITEVSGKVKRAGKTTWLLHLVRAVLDGSAFMGEPTEKTPVVYLTEQPLTTFRPQMEKAGLLGRDDLIVLFWADTLGLRWETVAQMAVAECSRRNSSLLIIDTLGQFAGLAGDSENNAGDALLAIQPLQKAAADGLGSVVSRHERKSGGAVGDSSRGSSAFAGAVDTVVAIRRPGGNHRDTIRSLQAVSRFDGVPDELVVELTPTGYVTLGRASDVAAQEAEEAILAAAPQSAEQAAELDELLEGKEIARATAQRAVKQLRSEGRLDRIGRGRKGSPYRYFAPEIYSAQTSTRIG